MSISKQDIKELRGDLSPFLIHLTRNGNYKCWADIYGLDRDDRRALDAKSSLEMILQNKKIEARSPFGYFNYKVPWNNLNQDSKIKRSWLRSVCFTETPVDYVYVQCEEIESRQFNFAPYGLAFFENSVLREGGNPVIYFNSKDERIRKTWDLIPILPNCKKFAPLMILCEGFGPPLFGNRRSSEVDFRWEREWRVWGHFNFDLKKDVAFGICPQNEIETFENLADKEIIFVDPRRPMGLIKKKLRQDERLKKLI